MASDKALIISYYMMSTVTMPPTEAVWSIRNASIWGAVITPV